METILVPFSPIDGDVTREGDCIIIKGDNRGQAIALSIPWSDVGNLITIAEAAAKLARDRRGGPAASDPGAGDLQVHVVDSAHMISADGLAVLMLQSGGLSFNLGFRAVRSDQPSLNLAEAISCFLEGSAQRA